MSDLENTIAKRMEQTINAALGTLPREQMLLSTQAAMQALTETLRVTVISNNEALLESSKALSNEIAEAVSTLNKDSITRLSATIAELLDSVPPDAVVSVEETTALVEKVRPYLPQETAERVEAEIQKAQTTDHKISGEILKKIFEIFVVPLVLLLVGSFLTSEHDQKEEDFWAAMSESQQEEIRLREQDIVLEKEILEYLKNLQELPVGVGQESDGVRNQDQTVNDSVDLSDDTPEKNALDKTDDSQN